MLDKHKLLVAIIRGANELIDHELSPDQIDVLRGVLVQLDNLALSAHERENP